MPNRLAHEKSPYLLQHAANPVDWYPWGDEAFARARREDRPIFLSVGYSTCHWCHVMEHESFEDEAVAAVLNREFVPVKVDREERPDVDRVYMAFVQATTGSGGWPMSVWLTPDLRPFYGGTYFPPDSRYGRPGFGEVLREVARAWRDRRGEVACSAEALTAQLRRVSSDGGDGPAPGAAALAAGVNDHSRCYDARRGGFGQAPKFPRPAELLFLLREAARTGDAQARAMVEGTLQAMAMGGMRDHVGGGFHRYAVDADWRVPHFEKMLYDQAQLVLAYLEAFQLTGDAAYADVAEDTLTYVARDLTHQQGGFFSAEDADSVPAPGAVSDNPSPLADQEPADPSRKTEGAFYLWTWEAFREVLDSEADLVRARFGARQDGNAPFDPHDEFGAGNLLYIARDLDALAAAFGGSADAVAARLEDARRRLFVARARRPRPQRDDKVITAWNGLMIAAFARAARVLGLEEHLVSAVRAASFARDTLWDASAQTLRRRYRDGHVAGSGFADDYANLVFGLLELFQTGGDPAWLEWAVVVQRQMDRLFWDGAAGGWFSTTGADSSVLLRLKDDYDGAEPGASSVAVGNLLTLAHLTGDATWGARVDGVFKAFGSRLTSSGRAMPLMLAALSAHHAGSQQVVLVGPRDDQRTRRLADALARCYVPFAVTLAVEPGDHQARVARAIPAVAAMTMVDGRPAAYVCRDFTCQAPVTDPDQLTGLLRAPANPR